MGFSLLQPGSGYVGFLVDKMAQGWVFSEYFVFNLPTVISSTALCSFIVLPLMLYSLNTDSSIK
jgi:hypothetical protein